MVWRDMGKGRDCIRREERERESVVFDERFW